MDLKKRLGNSLFLQVFVALTFFLSGLLVSVIQAILFVTLAFVNIDLYRKVNYFLTYTIWSQLVGLADWWAGTKLTIYFADEESKKMLGQRHAMFVMNHNYEIDWLITWLVTDRLHMLSNSKSFAKKALRWVPIIGWSWVFGEFAFLERNWDKDSYKIANALNNFLDYKWPISFLFFAEGTRFTADKHAAGVKFATERGLPILKHHLVPRTKGFNFCVTTFKEKYPDMGLYQCELRFPNDSPPPNFMSLARGRQLQADLYLRFIPLHKIPSDTEKQLNAFLHDLYKEKDELVDHYIENGKFPGIETVIPARKTSLINWLAWLLFAVCVLPYAALGILTHGSWLTIGIITVILIFGFYSINKMISSTKISQTSSKYGIKKDN